MGAAHPDWRFEVAPDIGHVPMLEAPEWTAARIGDWLATEGAAAAAPGLAWPEGQAPPRSVDLAVPSLPVGGPQPELLELAGGRAGQRRRGTRPASGTCSRPARPGSGSITCSSVSSLPVGRHHQGDDHLAPGVVGDADHRHLGHAVEREDGVLHLDGRDVLPSGDDHVLLPVEDAEVPLVVDEPAVAGVEPSALEGRRRSPRAGASTPAITVLLRASTSPSSSTRSSVPDRRRPGPHQLAGPVGRGGSSHSERWRLIGQQGRRLGQAVDLDELPAELGLDPLDGPAGRRGAGHHDPGAVPPGDGPVPVGQRRRGRR